MRKALVSIAVMCTLSCCVGYKVSERGTTTLLTSGVQNEAQLLSGVRAEIAKLSPEICYVWRGQGDAYQQARKAAELLMRDGAVVAFALSARRNFVTLTPTYADNEYMLRAYRNPQYKSTLTANQKQALALAESVVRKARSQSKNQYECALKLHDWIVNHGRYRTDLHGKNSANVTTGMLLNGAGVCDSYTRVCRLMLSMAGIENRFVAGEANNENHCWNLARLDGHWVHIDCTYSDPTPDEAGRVYHTHFAIPDSLIARDHSWKRADYPAANSIELYYPIRYAAFASIEDFVIWCKNYRMKPEYIHVTAYVEELRSLGHDYKAIMSRVGDAHAKLGEHVLLSFSLEDDLPGVIVAKCRVR